jgi:glycine oxidase
MGALAHPHQFISTGHFRNGILLAPASAVALADLIEGRTPSVDLQPFSAARFQLPT